jgi:SAM-dependent methyltransferase
MDEHAAQPEADWAASWRDLVDRAARVSPERSTGDFWDGRAEGFNDRVLARSSEPDLVRDFVLGSVQAGSTVLDIGAGTGGWAIPLAARAARVTALDSSASMLAVLRRNIAGAAVTNIDIVAGSWPDVRVADHDFSLAAHSVYGSADLPRFVEHMMAVTRRTCFLLVRMPEATGVMAAAAARLWGIPWDRPNFVVAHHVLLELGVRPSVLVGELASAPRTSATLDEALERLKHHFALAGRDEHDDYLRGLLARRLEHRDGRYRWPPEARSALLYWSVE